MGLSIDGIKGEEGGYERSHLLVKQAHITDISTLKTPSNPSHSHNLVDRLIKLE